MISYLLCYMGVINGFLHVNILAVVLGCVCVCVGGGGGGISILKVSLRPGGSIHSDQSTGGRGGIAVGTFRSLLCSQTRIISYF